MKIIILTENTEGVPGTKAEHGLSVYVETKQHVLLSDTGASDALLVNAGTMGIDLKKVDTVILSHGHYDHCGGMISFSEVNNMADIYIREGADGPFYDSAGKYIGIDKRIMSLPNLHIVNGDEQIDEELFLFGDVKGRKLFPFGNVRILKEENGVRIPDTFEHEQNLVIYENEKRVLISGCAHCGIVNILDRFYDIFGTDPDAVITGFHLMKKTAYQEDEIALIKETALNLKNRKTLYYSGHCTGDAVTCLKEILGDQLQLMYTGLQIRI